MALDLGELEATISVDDQEFEQGLDQAQGRFSQFSEKLQLAAAAAGAIIAGALGAALAEAMELDEARVKMEQGLGDPALAKRAGEAAGRMYGRGFTTTSAEALEAVGQVAATNLVPDGAPEALEQMAIRAQTLSKILGTDLGETVVHVNTLFASGLAKSGTEAFDVILAASRKVPAAMGEDLLASVDSYAQHFATLGISAEQAMAMVASQAKNGREAMDKVGDAVKEFTILATNLDDTGESYKKLGLNGKQMANEILAGGDRANAATAKIVAALKSVKDPSEQAALALKFFGTPLEDMSVADIPEFLDSLGQTKGALGEVTGATDKAAKAFEESAGQQLTAFKNQLKGAVVDQVAKAIPYLRDMAGWIKENKNWIEPTVKVLGVLAAVIGVLIVVTKIYTAVQAALNVVMALNPIGLIIIGVMLLIAAIVLLWMKCEGFRNVVKAVFGFIADVAVKWWQTFSAMWVKIGTFFANLFVGWWNLFTGFWTKVWEVVTSLASGWWETFSGFWTGLWEKVTGIASAWWEVFSGFWSGVFNALGAAKDWVVDKWNALIRFVTSIPGRISSAAAGMWDGIKNAFRSAINWIIGRWNGLSLRIPGVSIPGIGQVWGGMTLNTPDLPYLAAGGSMLRSGVAVLGDRGPEAAFMPAGAVARPLGPGDRNRLTGGGGETVVRVIVSGTGLLSGLREEVSVRGGNVQTVLGGV